MKEIKLTNRLAAVAELAGHSRRVADVGTDHGYIPIWLIKSGLADSVIASDVNPGPLERAKESVKESGVLNGIEFVLSDGLTHLRADSADTVIIAGMGGETIADIMSRANWISDGKHRFVLQPMTKLKELTVFLYKSGLHIKDARLAEDSGEIYIVLLAVAGREAAPSPAGMIVPDALFRNGDPLIGRYLDILIERSSFAAEGMKSAKANKAPERLEDLETVLRELKDMREGLQCRQ